MTHKTAVRGKDFFITAVFFSLAALLIYFHGVNTKKTKISPPEPVLKSKSQNIYIPERKRLNINTAPRFELTKIPGIGSVLSKKIVDYRTENPFSSLQDIAKVDGIGKEKLKKIAPYIIIQKVNS